MITINEYQSVWFAWYPVKTESEEWVWLDYVGRTEEYLKQTKRGVKYKYKYYKINFYE